MGSQGQCQMRSPEPRISSWSDCTHGAVPTGRKADVDEARAGVVDAFGRLDDAHGQYHAERHTKPMSLTTAIQLFNGTSSVRSDAELFVGSSAVSSVVPGDELPATEVAGALRPEPVIRPVCSRTDGNEFLGRPRPGTCCLCTRPRSPPVALECSPRGEGGALARADADRLDLEDQHELQKLLVSSAGAFLGREGARVIQA